MTDDDARDAQLLEAGQFDRLLAKYHLVILARCIRGTRNVDDGQDVAQDVEFRLFREFQAGKRYPGVPFRVVVHQVVKWTIKDHFQGRPTDVPLPDGWSREGQSSQTGRSSACGSASSSTSFPTSSARPARSSTSGG